MIEKAYFIRDHRNIGGFFYFRTPKHIHLEKQTAYGAALNPRTDTEL